MGITDVQYPVAIDPIRPAIAGAEARGEEAVFNTDMHLRMAVGFLSEKDGSPVSVSKRLS